MNTQIEINKDLDSILTKLKTIEPIPIADRYTLVNSIIKSFTDLNTPPFKKFTYVHSYICNEIKEWISDTEYIGITLNSVFFYSKLKDVIELDTLSPITIKQIRISTGAIWDEDNTYTCALMAKFLPELLYYIPNQVTNKFGWFDNLDIRLEILQEIKEKIVLEIEQINKTKL